MNDYERLYNHVDLYVRKILNQTPVIAGRKTVELKQLDIRNQYGLEISEIQIVNDATSVNPYVFRVTYRISDYLPLGNGFRHTCTVEGRSYDETMRNFIEHISSKVYCRDCGRLQNETEYILDEEQCIKCVLETLLLTRGDNVQFCSICQQNTCRFVTLRCGHSFHRRCVSRLLKNRCPNCSAVIDSLSL